MMSISATGRATRVLGGVAVAALMAGQAWAAGFEVKERSATAQGSANAGASSAAEDVSYMYFNPASIAFQSGFSASFGASVIFPSAELSNVNGVGPAGAFAGGSATSDDLAVVPSGYLSAQISDTVYLGLGVAAPFGLVTDYGDTWDGRFHATRSALTTINVSPTIAYRPIPEIAIAGGPVIEYAKAELKSAVALGLAGEGTGSFEGDDIALGWALGIIVEPIQGTRIGAGFRSKITHDVELDGKIGNNLFTAFDGPARTSVSAPAQLNLGITQELNEDWAIMFDAQWTQWSSFDELRILTPGGSTLTTTTTKWDDTWFLSLGARYKASEDLTLRFGAAYDMGAAPDGFRTPRIPDANRIWGSVGATYDLTESVALNGAYTFVWVEDSKIAIDGALPENATRGSLNADVESNVHIVTIGATFKY